MLSIGVLAGPCLPYPSMTQMRLHKKWELTHVNYVLYMSTLLQILILLSLWIPLIVIWFLLLLLLVTCPGLISVMYRRLGFLKAALLSWKQNFIFVSSFCMWRWKQGNGGWERVCTFLLAYLGSIYVREFFHIPGIHSYMAHSFPLQLQSLFIYYYN